MNRKRILILGAGLAGLSAAWHLQRKNQECLIFEKESEVGGLSRSKKINGFTFDYCGHLLHFKHRYTYNLVKGVLKDNLTQHQRSAWVYSHHKYNRYPFQSNLYGLPAKVIKECLLGFIDGQKKKFIKEEDLNFLQWINQTFGKGIAKHFMLPYNTKFWTVPPENLTCAWLDGFVPVPSLSELIEGTVEESKRQFGYNAWFWYPKKEGIGSLALNLASEIKNIHCNCKIEEINLVEKTIRLTSGKKDKFDYLISTIPLPELAYNIKGLPWQIKAQFRKLSWNSIFNLNLGVEKLDYSGRHWIYFPQKELCFFRIGFFHNFSPSLTPSGKSSLYVEVSYSKDKPIDKNNIISRIKEDLEKIGVLAREDKICTQVINDIRYGYPIYDSNYQRSRKEIIEFLYKKHILPCGRYGSWQYFSMENTILDGKRTAEELLAL